MEYRDLVALRQKHPAWRLLVADHAPLIASFLFETFIRTNIRTMAEPEIASRLDDYLYSLRSELGDGAFPRPATHYLDAWASDEHAWLRKYYPTDSDEPHFDLTPATERAIDWLTSLEQRRFVGTESRLMTVFELLRQLVEGTETDPWARIAELERRKADIEAEIRRTREGHLYLLDATRIKERYPQIAATARELLSDFREVEQTIGERIGKINQSLHEIDYNPNRFIVLNPEHSTDPEIRDFQQDLRACTEGALTGSEETEYSEGKFLQVKRIIERFRGREGTSELDKRWTRKVTDVRNWFVFSASERWRDDGREHEHYTDSGGKSGGQKEKLAYTVLAASLAYQFGLEWGETRSRSFRFVLIDEAFGRGSDESTRYGLELFRRLHLQLLVVTPLQKIHVIEPYIASVGFVHNDDGSRSMLRNLTIEEYRAEQMRRAG